MPDTLEPESRGEGRLAGEDDWSLTLDDGVSLRGYRRDRCGPRAGVFVHGFRSHCDGDKARHLSATAGGHGWDWLRFDQRGCGRSGGNFRCFTVSGAVADLQRTLDALEQSSFVLVGSSLGALIAIHAASAGRHRIDGLVLIAPALRFADRFIHDHLDAGELDAWRRRGYRWFPDLYAGACYRLDYRFCDDALRWGEAPGKLPCPVRVIHGTRDELLPLADTRDWVSHLDCPAAGLEIIDGGDHRLTGWSDIIARQTVNLWKETR